MFCASKLVSTTQCTLFCSCSQETASKFNVERQKTYNILGDNNSNLPYDEKVLEELYQRFEEPNDNCRWDKPLFVSYPNEILMCEEIYEVLFKGKKLAPNLSTLNVSNFQCN